MQTLDSAFPVTRLRRLSLAAALAIGIGSDSGDAPQAWATAEHRARAVEVLALSSVSGSVPERAAVRKAQAAAIIEARRLGVDLSIASVGSGSANGADAAADRESFDRIAERFPETFRATLERDAFRERLAKAWQPKSAAAEERDPYNASAQVISDPHSRVSACVVELHAAGQNLRAMLAMTFHDTLLDAIEAKARRLGIAAADVAFLAAAHESSHCVLGTARRSGLLDTGWADPSWPVPRSWAAARSEDDHDVPALAKAEESAADLLAVIWAADVLGVRKARKLGRLSIFAVRLGARAPIDDGLHDSSRVLARLLGPGPVDRGLGAADPTRLAWEMAAADTRAEVLDSGRRH